MFRQLRYQLAQISMYRNILNDRVLRQMVDLLDNIICYGDSSLEALDHYHLLVYEIHQSATSFQDHLLNLIIHDDNPFSQAAENQGVENIPEALRITVGHDLQILQSLFRWEYIHMAEVLHVNPRLLNWEAEKNEFEGRIKNVLANTNNWQDHLFALAEHYARHSRGIISRFRALRWQSGELEGIDHPDKITLDDLVGYDSQKEDICRNTEIFLRGYPANNILLYGSRGTGKSSMIKALLHKYCQEGLHLVELGRDQIQALPELVPVLRGYRVRFIVFIDDLSFEDNETEYKGLKAVMEGSLESRPDNLLIYATSNRRHLVREYFSDRGKTGEEIHTMDTVQEKLSLSDRFGLTITFPSPGQQHYLEMVEKLIRERCIDIDHELMRRKALEWERAHHGTSGRTARQFVDSLGLGCYLNPPQ